MGTVAVEVTQEESLSLDVSVQVLHADPRIVISGEALAGVQAGTSLPGIGVVVATADATTFTVHGVNRRVVYRLVEYDAERDLWLAQWPD